MTAGATIGGIASRIDAAAVAQRQPVRTDTLAGSARLALEAGPVTTAAMVDIRRGVDTPIDAIDIAILLAGRADALTTRANLVVRARIAASATVFPIAPAIDAIVATRHEIGRALAGAVLAGPAARASIAAGATVGGVGSDIDASPDAAADVTEILAFIARGAFAIDA